MVETPEEAIVLRHVTARSRATLEHKDWQRRGYTPSKIGRNFRRKPNLYVQATQGVLSIADGRLDLDDGQNARGRMIREDVDASPITEVIETDLHPNGPSVTLEKQYELVLECGMACVEQPRQPLTLPEHLHPQETAQLLHAGLKLAGRDVVEPIVFDPGDHLAGHTHPRGEILLPPPTPLSQSTNLPSNTPSTHSGDHGGRAVTSALPAAYRHIHTSPARGRWVGLETTGFTRRQSLWASRCESGPSDARGRIAGRPYVNVANGNEEREWKANKSGRPV